MSSLSSIMGAIYEYLRIQLFAVLQFLGFITEEYEIESTGTGLTDSVEDLNEEGVDKEEDSSTTATTTTDPNAPLNSGDVHPCKKCEWEKDPFKGYPVVPAPIKELLHAVIIPSIFHFPEALKKDEVENFEHNLHFHMLEYFEQLCKREETEKAMQFQDMFNLK